ENAISDFDRAIALAPNFSSAFYNKGKSLGFLRRYEEAFAAYDTALALRPDLAEALVGRGHLLYELRRYDDALAAYDKALALKPVLADAWLGRGNVCVALNRYGDAFAAYDKALSIRAGLAEAWLGRGNVFNILKRYDDALAAYDKALSIRNDLAEAWLGRGDVFVALRRYDEALAACERALSLEPDLVGLEGERIRCKMNLCDWTDFEAECKHLVQSVANGKANTDPFALLGVGSSVEDQFNCARLWVQKRYPPRDDQPPWREAPDRSGKIRLGYVSPDFRQHPVADLAVGVFEGHDRSQFEVSGISIGPNDNSEIRRRLERAFDTFVDAEALDADDIARLIRGQGIDILIDLSGFTWGARTEIFARRPAPVQVNYLGYPGTMGAEYIDYLIADPILVPASHRASYMEKIAYLPHSYMPHDGASRPVSDRWFERAEFGLPASGFVFCCFNNAYKLNPVLFRQRMKLLQAVEGSVLWLSETNMTAAKNLRREAAAAGVDPARLVFAGRVPSAADHLARHRLADLFLDTLPYNAHATASDALWTGLPVLTQIGETFAGRVAASQLTAVGLPELIVRTPEQFEIMAIELATSPQALAAVKDKLVQNRSTMPLFDTALYTRHLESAYAAMYRRHQNGLLPDHIYVPE
ncbi:MAG: tetratricopeptide repeat protein, partial [Bradyrhizobium sp.]|uniref:O-linked N-acetylglucosamine transferase, SPINDLY family protein n=1 Tax=Bradyrhizobium sp. TaxID=376 RepID=UPI001229ABCD